MGGGGGWGLGVAEKLRNCGFENGAYMKRTRANRASGRCTMGDSSSATCALVNCTITTILSA